MLSGNEQNSAHSLQIGPPNLLHFGFHFFQLAAKKSCQRIMTFLLQVDAVFSAGHHDRFTMAAICAQQVSVIAQSGSFIDRTAGFDHLHPGWSETGCRCIVLRLIHLRRLDQQDFSGLIG